MKAKRKVLSLRVAYTTRPANLIVEGLEIVGLCRNTSLVIVIGPP